MSQGFHLRAMLLPLLLGAVTTAGPCGCDDGEVRFGPKPMGSSARDAGASSTDYELDLQLLGDRKHKVVGALKGRDVRRLLPRTPRTLKRGQPVFALVPVGRSWNRVGWRTARVTSVDGGDRFSLHLEEGRVFADVPGAMILPVPRGRPKTGQVVRVRVGRGLPFGRVRRVQPDTVVVATSWLAAAREVRARREEVLPVSSGLEPAGPLVYRVGSRYRLGSLVVSEPKHRWVLGAEGVVQRLPWTVVKPIRFGRVYRPGDQARAALPVFLRLVTVIKVLDGGVRYEVGWQQTRRRVVSFAALAPP